MPEAFAIERDDEFYVYLKASLPTPYRIESEPSTSYYSEWSFKYNLYDDGKLLKTIEGDFRELEAGKLIQEAHEILGHLCDLERQC